MRYDFSSAFLIIKPPATSFGEAWEHLCTDLLAAEHGTEAMIEPTSPDHGVDIYNQKTHHGYQCKSSEQGTAGTIPPMQSIGSLQTAVKHRQLFPWMVYSCLLYTSSTRSSTNSAILCLPTLDTFRTLAIQLAV